MKKSISKSMKFNLFFLFFIFMIFTQHTYGADENESWTKISFEKKINSHLKIDLSQGLRLNEQNTNLKLAFFEGSILYKGSNGIKIGIPYRYTILEDKIKHRLSLEASYQLSYKYLRLKSRLEYYRIYNNGYSNSDNGTNLGDLFRNKFTIKLKTEKKFQPYISAELFYLYNTGNNPFDEYRTSCGLEIDLSKKKSINLFYVLKKEGISSSNQNEVNIFGLSYVTNI